MMATRRGRRAGVEDRWRKADGTPTSRDGAGRRWLARYVDESGEERTQSFTRKVDAQSWLDDIAAAIRAGTYVSPQTGKISIAELYDQWSKAQGHIKQTTAATRAVTWSAYVRPHWEDVAVKDVQPSHVRAWVHGLKEGGAGPETIENALGVFRMICRMALDDRRIPRNPCDGVKAPRREHRARGYLNHPQVELLAEAMPTDLDASVVRFLAYTGLRWGEMAALRVENFDLARRRLNIRQAVAEVRGQLVWSTAKNHERRSVPYPAFLADELVAMIRHKGRDEQVFSRGGSVVLRVSTWRPRVFKPAVDRAIAQANELRSAQMLQGLAELTAEFPIVTPHDLRHTAASLAISAGANVKAVQTMLGHKSAALTLDTYADLFPDDLEAVAAALDRARDSALQALRISPADCVRTGGK
ncbi:tyrosine-type recombinase/integrase [Williamsia sp. MIQD14]|uniref:tyrosine-type recombinase/integrase n=1 Tax=Williamsia sp. MIQD14 TaxID=3425703 RepID=UPI003DA118D5